MKNNTTVEKWEEGLPKVVSSFLARLIEEGEIKPRSRTGWVALESPEIKDFIHHSVQEAKAEMVEKIEKIMDKDRAKEIGDNIEIAFGERSCKVCGYNPEYQREYILTSLKQEESK